MSSYQSFAEVYDRLMTDVNYKARTSYLLKLFSKYDKKPSLVLDVACGTGGFSNELAKKGIEVIGIDMSEEMLAVARQNSAEKDTDVLFLCQRAEELDLYGTVDGAICCLDSLNHITDYKTLCKAFERITLFLETDRLFIFDVNTPFKHKFILGDNTFIIDEEDIFCAWRNSTDEDSLTTEIALDFFVKEEDSESYRRSEEFFSERAYTDEELQKAIADAGLETVAILDDMSDIAAHEYSERAIYITRKIKETKNG